MPDLRICPSCGCPLRLDASGAVVLHDWYPIYLGASLWCPGSGEPPSAVPVTR